MVSLRKIVFSLLILTGSLSLSAQDFLSAKMVSGSQLPVGAGILAAGDLNGDGVDDLVYSIPDSPSFSYSSVGIAFGTRSGFQFSSSLPQRLGIVTIADLNGDGRPDLIGSLSNASTALLFTYLNRGDGTFLAPVMTEVTTNTSVWPRVGTIFVADFDRDGKADIIATSNNNFFFFHGNGDGTVVARGSFTGRYANNYGIYGVADFNRDGKLDIVVCPAQAAMVEIRLGNGDGTFQTEYEISASHENSPVLGDFNGDGVLDIATNIWEGDSYPPKYSTVIYAGNGGGTFHQINKFEYGKLFASLTAARDFDGDGKLDLLFDSANGFSVSLGKGNGEFGPLTTYSAPRWMFGQAQLGDFDADGLLDIISAKNYVEGVAYFLKGYPGGKFDGAVTLELGTDYRAFASADLNHDGFADFVVGGYGTTIFLSNPDGTFDRHSDNYAGLRQLFLADLDGDHTIDALDGWNFRHGNGDGTFGNPVPATGSNDGVGAASIGDLNGDGKPDLFGLYGYYPAYSAWLGNGDGTFGNRKEYSLYSTAYTPKTLIADVNSDGVNDVLVRTSDSEVTILTGLGDGAGTLNSSGPSYPAVGFTVADANCDGKSDLITTSPDSGNPGIKVFLGDANGGLGTPIDIPTSVAYRDISTSDINLDGVPDLILTGGRFVAVMYGNGQGGFGPEKTFFANDGSQSPVVGDWNHDGAPDIAVVNSIGGSPSPQSISVLLNRAGYIASLSLSVNPAQYGQPLTLTASVTPTVLGAPALTGNVSLTVDEAQVSAPLTNGIYSRALDMPAVGNHVISGSYLGDINYAPKRFSDLSLTVTKASTTALLSTSANPALFGSTIDFSFEVHPAFAGVPTGYVGLWDGATLLRRVALDASGHAAFSLNNIAQGQHALTAKYEGDGNFVASSSTVVNELVLYPSTTSVSSSKSPVLISAPVTLTATVTSQYGNPTGQVSFLDGSRVLAQASLTGGTATFVAASLSQGTHNITASYQGDGTFVNGDSPMISQTITDFSVSAVSNSLSVKAGASGTYTLNVAPLSGFSGSVAFTCAGAPALATCAVSPSSLPVSGATASATVNITTTGSARAALSVGHAGPLFATMLALVFGFIASPSRARRAKRIAIFLCILSLGMCGLASCGGGSNPPPPPPPSSTPIGTSTLVVNASTTADGVTVNHSVSLTLNVN